MGASFIWKPSTVSSWKGGPVFLAPSESSGTPVITTASGQKFTGKFINNNEGRKQWVFPSALVSEEGLSLDYGGTNSKITSGGTSYEGNDLTSWAERSKGSLGDTSGGFGKFGPQTVGQFGAVPANLLADFPSTVLADFNSIKSAPYQFIDPQTFAEKFGDFNRAQTQKNFDQSKDMALEELGVELQGLEGFVPAASALKRRETSLDNMVNQEMRTNQVRSTLPGVEGDLNAQRDRAAAYAEGRIPDAVADRALNINTASRATDQGAAAGFGAKSIATSNLQALTSAEERVNLSKYGDQLLTGNIKTKADLLLAPTEYSNAGSQIDVKPSISGAALTDQNLRSLNNDTLISPTNALQSSVQQQQFKTNVVQDTRKFNAQGNFQESQVNAAAQNNMNLQKFGYEVGYAGALAGGLQNDINAQLGLKQQADYQKIFQDYLSQKQGTDQIKAITDLLGTLPGLISGISSLIKGASSGATGTNGGGSSGGSTSGGAAGNSPGDSSSGDGSNSSPPSDVPSSDSGGENSVDGPNSTPPSDATDPDIQAFSSETGADTSGVNTRALKLNGQAVTNAAQLSTTPKADSVLAGYNSKGQALFAPRSLQTSNDPAAGSQYVSTIKTVLDPLGVFSKEDSTTLDKIGAVAGDAAFAAELGQAVQRKDAKGFVSAVLGRYGQNISSSITADKNKQSGINASFSAFQLYSNWDNMSAAQRGIGLAAVGIQGYKYASGEDLGAKFVVKPNGDTPGLTVGQSLSLLSQGYNAYSLAKNWGNLSNIQKIVYGTQSAVGIAKTAQQFGFEGFGPSGAAVPNVSATVLADKGFVSTPQFGVGAINGPSGNVPPNYTVVSNNEKGVIAVPTPNLASWAGAASFGAGAYSVYANWGTGGTKGAVNGAVGGAAMAAGLSQMGVSNPYTLGAVVAVSMLGGTLGNGNKGSGSETLGVAAQGASAYAASQGSAGVLGSAGSYISAAADAYGGYQNINNAPKGEKGKAAALAVGRGVLDFYTYGFGGVAYDYLNKHARPVAKAAEDAVMYGTAFGWAALAADKLGIGGGKGKDQMGRDAVRGFLKKSGVVDDKFKMQLADGGQSDIGIDGSGGHHAARDSSKLIGKAKGSLASFDTDYTNDLDYAASMGGIALTRLLAGTKDKAIDQTGSQIGNGALGSVGHGQDMTPENYTKVMANLRGAYSKAGITSKADAFALANQAAAEGRISMTDLVSMHQAFIMMYDGNAGFNTAQSLMAGRWRGIESTQQSAPQEAPKLVLRSDVRSRNRQRYSQAA